jgi:2-(1,2-epoxy-1,2-dihydrophenyl)acetyl-CoA isomerase
MGDLIENVEGRIAILTLNRPDRLNALSNEMMTGLDEALRRVGHDPDIGVIVLTGAGRGFCAGGDVKSMASRQETTFEQRIAGLRLHGGVVLTIRTLPKIVIAMVNGPAMGAGLGIAAACDFRIAARSARFGTAFAGVGFSGDYGLSWTLTQLVGTAKARELFVLGDIIDAETALNLGLVTRVVDDASLREETEKLARRIAEGPCIAFGYMKKNLFAAETATLSEVLDLEAIHQARTGITEDHREARQAFVEKRRPVFRGR